MLKLTLNLRTIFYFFLSCIFMLACAMGLKTPSNEQNFQQTVAILPLATLENDRLNIKNLRDFRYNADESVASADYIDAHYRLSQLKTTWLGISHFGPMGMAHVFLSFEFNDGQYIAVSVEARLNENQRDGYSPIAGVFRQYNKIIVLATEQDIIGLRTLVRSDETLYLYPLNLSSLNQQALLLNFLGSANALQLYPDFYNTVSDNCLTGLLAEANFFRGGINWLDYRILLPGFADELAYEHGLLKLPGSFAQMKSQAWVAPNLLNLSVEDPYFSASIRAGLSRSLR